MLLRSVRIQDFRAVKSAAISFDPTTVLIGENDCGRSSVMEAIALALGWNAGEGEFLFQPFHFCSTSAAAISITLEFSESAPSEWDGEGFDILRSSLPAALERDRRFRLNVIRAQEAATEWAFCSTHDPPLLNDRKMLAWLRERMPVFWLNEGMTSARAAGASPRRSKDAPASLLAEQVNRHYRDLLEGTALDIPEAIEDGAAAAKQLLFSRTSLLANQQTPVDELLQEIRERRISTTPSRAPGHVRSYGAAAEKIGLLLLVGALLRSGAGRGEPGIAPLTLIENPEAHLHPMTLASIWSVIDRVDGQKIIGTHSETLLACARLSSVRRLTRRDGSVREWRVPSGSLDSDELRRYSYHLRSRRGSASFARCWLLVEGETEFWLMSEIARVCGYDFASEGVSCVEFAQCGLDCLIKVARHLGIEWHLLADGDSAGQNYVRSTRRYAGGNLKDRMTLLQEVDMEHCFWRHGYTDVFRDAAYSRRSSIDPAVQKKATAKTVIGRAIARNSKPYLAVLLLDKLTALGAQGVPPPLRNAVETCIRLARGAPPGPKPK